MALYTITNKGNIIKCKWNCELNHEHYNGTYENALKYFCVSEEDKDNIKSYGNLMYVILYHQTSDKTIPKLSNELFDILIRLQKEHKYWALEKDREKNAYELLDKAKEKGLLFDDKIIESLKSVAENEDLQISRRNKAKSRIYYYEKWLEC